MLDLLQVRCPVEGFTSDWEAAGACFNYHKFVAQDEQNGNTYVAAACRRGANIVSESAPDDTKVTGDTQAAELYLLFGVLSVTTLPSHFYDQRVKRVLNEIRAV